MKKTGGAIINNSSIPAMAGKAQLSAYIGIDNGFRSSGLTEPMKSEE